MTPTEWLRRLDEQDGYTSLLEEAGSLPLAAWRLARAQGYAWGISGVPSRRELFAAAGVIARRVGLRAVPNAASLAGECEDAGLLVV